MRMHVKACGSSGEIIHTGCLNSHRKKTTQNMELMDGNYTLVTEFILLGFPTRPELQIVLFLMFLTLYESFILAAMAYDRYVAICNPLLYTVVMSRGICVWLIVLSYIGGNMSSLVHTSFAFILKYCDKNVINHFFCDLPPLLKLSCTDTSVNEWLLSTYGSSVEIICFIVIVISYYFILRSVLRIRSSSGRKKTFSTCASHLTSVAIYQGTLLFIYSRPSYLYSPNTDKIISVFYTIIIPVLNPLIYSLRNKDVKDAAKRAVRLKVDSS
ncbi:olfactory receptor family 5 subfamily W member 7 isoform X4 [Canis lupus familiaris]|uniref:olfactory receptor family 5 subfamily W member 7 isoform X4 n=1 Tax=Canis lupus familiaris TaxID=9615 RepID=UPI000BAA239E|nr:olfactory receptor family 5 subfamily W member 7 isoform X4 [Canis lupus familiaris]|eukprot:XP_022261131.1 olfactory receptor-like protein OLF2 isoform X4 [Canis lupus familiaris]